MVIFTIARSVNQRGFWLGKTSDINKLPNWFKSILADWPGSQNQSLIQLQRFCRYWAKVYFLLDNLHGHHPQQNSGLTLAGNRSSYKNHQNYIAEVGQRLEIRKKASDWCLSKNPPVAEFLVEEFKTSCNIFCKTLRISSAKRFSNKIYNLQYIKEARNRKNLQEISQIFKLKKSYFETTAGSLYNTSYLISGFRQCAPKNCCSFFMA